MSGQDAFGSQQQQQQPSDWLEINAASMQVNETRYLVSQDSNLLLIKSIQATDNRARFRCSANNSYGNHQADTELRVELWPTSKQVELEPKADYIINNADFNQRQSMLFNCTIRAGLAPLLSIEWLKNGRPLFAIALAQFAQSSSATPINNQGQLSSHWLASSENPFSLLHSGANGSTFQGLLDDFNQEVSAIEYYLANSNQQQSEANSDLANSDSVIGGFELPLPANSPLADWLASANSNNNMINQDGRTQAGGGQYLLSSSSLNKLSSDELASSLESSSNSQKAATTTTTGRRLRQRVRLLNRDSLLYQLQIDQVRRSDRGSYQCRARSTKTILHATANLMLKDNPPQFVDTFASQLIAGEGGPNSDSLLSKTSHHNHHNQLSGQSNGQVSLRCVASGSPLPEISWTLSGFPVPEASRFRVGDYVTRDGLIVSFVNITNVQAEGEFSGRFECCIVCVWKF